MIELVQGSTAEVIKEMKALKRAAALAAKPILKKYTARDIRNGVPTEVERYTLQTHQRRSEYFKVTQYTPAYLEGYVIDYKFLSAFLRRTQGFTYKLEPGGDKLYLRYEKGYGASRVSGVVHLFNLSHHYEDLGYIPTIELKGVTVI